MKSEIFREKLDKFSQTQKYSETGGILNRRECIIALGEMDAPGWNGGGAP